MIEFVSAPDFQFLSWIPEATSLSLWKLIEHEAFLNSHNVSIANANGLLNLFRWWVSSKHFIIHPDIYFPDDQTHTRIVIPTDCILDIRLNVRRRWDLHALPSVDGQFVRVQRATAKSCFPDEKDKPLYAAIDAARSGQLVVAWVGDKNIWWLTAQHDKSSLSRDLVFRVWDAVSNWMERAVPVLEYYMPYSRRGILSITLDFNNAHQEQEKPIEDRVLKSSISVLSDKEKIELDFSFEIHFLQGLEIQKILLNAQSFANSLKDISVSYQKQQTKDSLKKSLTKLCLMIMHGISISSKQPTFEIISILMIEQRSCSLMMLRWLDQN